MGSNEHRTYVCRRIRLYELLTERGFEPYRTTADKYDCKRLVWLYTDSKELRDVVEEYYSTPHNAK